MMQCLTPRMTGLIAACLLVAGCVTSETTNNAGAGLPPGGSGSGSASGSGSGSGGVGAVGSQNASRSAGTSPLNSSTSPGEEVSRRAKIRLELAANHYQQQNYPLALQEADQAVKLDPSFSAGHGMLGLIYMAIGDRAKADDSFNRAIKLDPKDPELNNNFGWYLCQTGRQRESLAYFNKALEDRLYATPASAHSRRATRLRRKATSCALSRLTPPTRSPCTTLPSCT